MSLVVNTNISSLTAQRSLAESDYLLETAMERLSSGKKINSASDDAAGLAIVERMTAQINGLNMAIKNANDGISLTQSIEGALVEVTDMLQRLRELSVQASNDTNTSTDRRYIQDEVNLLIAEITRISANTRYNGQKVLDGTFTNKQLQVGTEGGERISISVDSVASDALGAYTKDTIGVVATRGATAPGSGVTGFATAKIMGKGTSETINIAAGASAQTVASSINAVSGNTGVSAVAKTYAKIVFTGTAASYDIKLNGTAVGTFTASTGDNGANDAVAKVNAVSGTTGITATADSSNALILYHSAGADIAVENASTAGASDFTLFALGMDGVTVANSDAGVAITDATDGTFEFGHVVGNLTLTSSNLFSLVDATSDYFATASASLSDVSTISLRTQSGADAAIAVIDGAIEKVSSMRAGLGAIENRLEHTVSNLMNVAENTSDSKSRIYDADFSVESANLARAQVLQQVGAAMLTQANARPQLVLQLLQ
jgi:flagellin